jgi:purine-binding chemotaxis protein CheW
MSEGRNALARHAAGRRAPSEEEAKGKELLTFELGAMRYALPLSCVREIVRLPPVTEVPRAPYEVLGVISVRGAVTTVLDLRRKLQLETTPLTSKSRVLLVDQGQEVTGLLVDAVLQVCRLRPEEIELSSVLGADAPGYLAGIGRPSGEKRDDERRAARRTAEIGEILLLLDPSALLRF